jgi:hypothetical protein
MKNYFLISLVSFFILTNCSISDDSNNTPPKVIKIYWNLVNVSGGIVGVDDDFQTGTIIWTFNDETETLNVVNDNTDDTKQDGLATGDYTYSVVNIEENSFLIVDSNELGSLTLNTSQLIINENETSEGSTADGFIYTFSKTTITQ